jgi:carbon monoxide dehydrogenase subunit G
MEHEVYVPFPVGSVRAALAEPERVVRCVPGLWLDAAAEPASGSSGALDGRMRVRVGGHTVTYRGALKLTERDTGFAVEGEGTEARGRGSVKLALTVAPRAAEDGEGTVLACSGTVRGEGRIAEFGEKQTVSTGRRLLDRFGSSLTESLAVDTPGDDNERAIPGIPAPEESPDSVLGAEDPPSSPKREQRAAEADESAEGPQTPEGPARPGAGEERQDAEPEPTAEPAEPVPAEAAHARRTMIGRSAEEVDHAPPRGRYAPVPPSEATSTTATLRWAAPAAAIAVATAVVLSRVLRGRGGCGPFRSHPRRPGRNRNRPWSWRGDHPDH